MGLGSFVGGMIVSLQCDIWSVPSYKDHLNEIDIFSWVRAEIRMIAISCQDFTAIYQV